MPEKVTLKVTSAFTIGGDIARPGELVEVTVSEAKDLLQRGKAVLAVEADAPRVAKPIGLAYETKAADEGAAPAAAEAEVAAEAPATEAPKSRRKGK